MLCYLASGTPAPGPWLGVETIRLVLSQRLGQSSELSRGNQHGFRGGGV